MPVREAKTPYIRPQKHTRPKTTCLSQNINIKMI